MDIDLELQCLLRTLGEGLLSSALLKLISVAVEPLVSAWCFASVLSHLHEINMPIMTLIQVS